MAYAPQLAVVSTHPPLDTPATAPSGLVTPLRFLDDGTPFKSCGVYTMACGNSVPHDVKMADERVRVWVVDDQASFRLATAATVDATKDFVMAGECETGESAIELIPDGGGGILLMDIHMPGIGGIEATRRIRAAHPDLMVLLMSTYDVEDLPAGAADCGATAYLHKEHLSPDMLTRLWRAAN